MTDRLEGRIALITGAASGIGRGAALALAAEGANAIDLNQLAAAGTPLGYAGLPADIAAGIVYLASDDARYVTGSELVIDGGMTAR